jgi:hypothetical protein
LFFIVGFIICGVAFNRIMNDYKNWIVGIIIVFKAVYNSKKIKWRNCTESKKW